MEKKCKIDNCGNIGKLHKNGRRYFTKGMCVKHYARLLRYKNPEYVTKFDKRPAIITGDTALIPLGVNGKHGYTIVDKEFAYLAGECNWTLHPYGYAYGRGSGGKMKYIHKLVVPNIPRGLVRDHINRDKLDNRKANIRVTTQKNNSFNRGSDRNTSSEYKGVSYSKKAAKWRAYITENGRFKHLGYFLNEYDAAMAYNKRASELHGEFAYFN